MQNHMQNLPKNGEQKHQWYFVHSYKLQPQSNWDAHTGYCTIQKFDLQLEKNVLEKEMCLLIEDHQFQALAIYFGTFINKSKPHLFPGAESISTLWRSETPLMFFFEEALFAGHWHSRYHGTKVLFVCWELANLKVLLPKTQELWHMNEYEALSSSFSEQELLEEVFVFDFRLCIILVYVSKFQATSVSTPEIHRKQKIWGLF